MCAKVSQFWWSPPRDPTARGVDHEMPWFKTHWGHMKARATWKGSGWQLLIIKANFQRATKSLRVSNVIDLQCFLLGVYPKELGVLEAAFLCLHRRHRSTINHKLFLSGGVSFWVCGANANVACRFITGCLTNLFAVVLSECRPGSFCSIALKKILDSEKKQKKICLSLCDFDTRPL